jgi:hypothetical protein
MHSSAKVFTEFVSFLLGGREFSEIQLSEILEEFDGVGGVIEGGFYISAYEEIARHLARKKSLDEMIAFFLSNHGMLSKLPGEQYYFVESAVDVYSSDDLDVSGLIDVSPERYKKYLIGRFV